MEVFYGSLGEQKFLSGFDIHGTETEVIIPIEKWQMLLNN